MDLLNNQYKRDDLIFITTYLHSDKESMEDTIIRTMGKDVFTDLPIEVQRNLLYMLYEIEFEIVADPETGDYRIISIKDGDRQYYCASLGKPKDSE